MIPIVLEWTPAHNVNRARDLGYLITTHATFPAFPAAGQLIYMKAYALDEPEPRELAEEYFAFTVEDIRYDWEGPSTQPEVVLVLALNIVKSDIEAYGSEERYESKICDVLLNVYGWKSGTNL